MSCDCINNIKTQLGEKIKGDNRFKDKVVTIKSMDESIIFDGNEEAKVKTYSVFRAEHHYKTATGRDRTIKEDFNVTHKYCPYCGKKY